MSVAIGGFTVDGVVWVEEEKIGGVAVDVYYPSNDKANFSVLMIHGMFAGGWCFEDWARFLCRKGIKVYVIKDLHSGYDISKIKFEDYVDKVGFLLKKLMWDEYVAKPKPIIIGHSMGGLIIQKLAERYPHLVGGIILVVSAPPKGISAMSWSVAKAMFKHLPSLIFNLPLKIDRESTFKLLLNCL